jgi:MFS family permease
VGARERRRAIGVLAAGTALAAAVLAGPWLWGAVVGPLALVVWLLLRLFVLSVHQAVYWVALVLAAAALLVGFLRRRARLGLEPPDPAAPHRRREHPVESWRSLVEQTASGLPATPTFGWGGFVRLVVSLGALEQRVPADYLLHEALRAGQVPLPPDVHAFLFPPSEPCPATWAARAARRARRLRGVPRRALRRLTGQDRADRLAAVERCLSFLETSLEMPRHDHHPDPPLR